MNKKVLHTLEYDKIIPQLCEHATSAPGRSMCEALLPSDNPGQISLRLMQTQDAVSYLLKNPHSPSFGNLKDFSLPLSRLTIGGSLNAVELLALAAFLENVARIKAYGRDGIRPQTADTADGENEGDDTPPDSLAPFFEELLPLSEQAAEIRRCILSEDEIADDASPALRDLRRKKSNLEGRIHSHLQSMVNGSARTYLQDPVITQKNGRYCLPVKAEHKSSVPGIVHERSSSGSTLFIEPSAIVDYNNQIRETEQEEREEIDRILEDLSLSLSAYSQAIKRNCELMTLLDFIFAKGALALSMKASLPVMTTGEPLHLRKARHPLLSAKTVVPIDIELDADTRQLIITGPNTGGKTVTLKTVGLLSLMAQAGLFIPALDRSSLPIYREVWADIGDEQSIEQNLSTFSSHMTNISQILKQADERSLVLFDELCSGTDPDEGAALAISILETLSSRRVFTMATTHYSEIKLYALSTPGVTTACCEFDVQTLSPTYRLLIGIPGKSNAFAIASRLGISDRLIDRAREMLSKDREDFEDVIASLEKSRIAMEADVLTMETQKKELEERLLQLEKQEATLENRRQDILQKANEEARDILADAKQVADETIRSFRDYADQLPMREMEQKRSGLREKIGKYSEGASTLGRAPKKAQPSAMEMPATMENINAGSPVRIISMSLEGTATGKPDTKGNVTVRCGSFETKAKLSDLILLPMGSQDKSIDKKTGDSRASGKQRSSYSRMAMGKSMSVGTEINLLGKTTDEAIYALDKYLDDAYIAHVPVVRVVHGKGTGALRDAVHNYLRRQKHVASYRLGEFGEGDAGVTIVTFK